MNARIDSQLHPIFTTGEEKWGTPRWLFTELDREFGFTLDVCATAESAKCKAFFSPEQDGLTQEWTGSCWLNPPYGKGVGDWLRKAHESSQAGCTVVALLPARTDTAWFHDWVLNKAELRFRGRRLTFAGFGGKHGGQSAKERNAAPFPSILAIYRTPGFSFTSPDEQE